MQNRALIMPSPSLSALSLPTAALLCCGALLALPGCLFDGEDGLPPPPPTRVVTLAELPEVRAVVNASQRGTAMQRSLFLELKIAYHGSAALGGLGLPYAPYCPTLDPSFRVTLDGEPFTMVNRGHWVPDGLGDQYDCFPPSTEIEIPLALQRSNVVLSAADDSLTITMPLGDLLLPR